MALNTFVRLAIAVAAALPSTVVGVHAREEVSPVQKVIALIDSMRAKVTTGSEEQQRNFQEFARHCDKEASEKNRAIKDAQDELDDLTAAINNAQANIGVYDSTVGELSQQISGLEGEMNEAKAIRKKGNADFVAAETELIATVDSLARAKTALTKEGGAFLQLSGQERHQIGAVVQDLGLIIDASWVTEQDKSSIMAFLQQQENNDDDDSMSMKAPADGDGEGQSTAGIVQTVADMEEKAQTTLSNTRKEEMKAQHSFQMLEQGMSNELASLKKELATTTSKKQSTIEELAQSEKDAEMTKTSLHESGVFVKELKHECQMRAGEFETSAKDSMAELEALKQAKTILSKKFDAASSAAAAAASFLQTSSRTQLRSTTRATATSRMTSFYGELMEGNKAQALRSIDQLGRKLHSMVLVSLAFRAASDPFAKIRSMIEEMVAKLLQEAAEEADQKAFCDKEIGDSNASETDKSQKLDTLDARLGKLSAAQAKMTGQVVELTQEVSEIDAAMTEATKMRQQERGTFVKESKDLSESQEACAGAIQVLQEYYEGASSFVQLSMSARSSIEATGGEGILGLLEVAESDFATMLAEAKAAEGSAAEEFEKLTHESRVLKATKLADAKAKQSELKSMKTSIDEFSSDKEGVQNELDAVTAYLDKLKPECETKMPSADEKRARRTQEIEGLRNALSILEGTGV